MWGRFLKCVLRRAAPSGSGLMLTFAFGVSFAHGATPVLPSGASVAAGSAIVTTPIEGSALIVQSTQKAIINWRSFSVGAGSNVTFQQPSGSAITLNRVVGTNGASVINGNLFANGQIWIVNNNGILFGQGSHIDLGGLIATTSDIRDGDFLAGKYDFGVASANPNATIINGGSIKASNGGSVVLSGARVANEGAIEAKLGQIVLGGANAFSVDFDGDNLIRYAITSPVSQTPKDADGKPAADLVSNSGSIAAQGGRVLLTARAARSVVNSVINSTGIIEATTASMQNGQIVLDAGDEGTINVSGRLDVSGKNAGETGGKIALFADTVAVADGARLDGSGDAGGGTILIGGSLHGAGTEPNAQTVRVGDAAIAADATGNGNGGTVAVYSVGETDFAGSVSAKGGLNGGDGGEVETSGRDLQISRNTHVDTSAAKGGTGSWLLDPDNLDIGAATGSLVAAIADTNVTLQADNISLLSPLNYVSANSLTLLAKQNVTLDASLQNTGTGAIFLTAGWDGVTAPGSVSNTPGAFGANNGTIIIGGSNAIGGVALGSLNGATILAAHDLILNAKNGYAQLGFHGDAGGDITANLTGNLSLTGGSGVGAFAQIGHGGYLSQGANSGSITVTVAGDVSLAAGNGFAAYAQIGHGGFGSTGDQVGNIVLKSDGNLAMTGVSNSAYAQIGNGGGLNVGVAQGDIDVQIAGNVALAAARIGNNGTSIDGSVLVSAGGDLSLGAASSLNATGSGDALVLAARGDFINQAGATALNVSGGGRWLAFLNAPSKNFAGGLTASPFYNRDFDFLNGTYAPLASAGNRFVYVLAPVLTVTPDNNPRIYGAANTALTAKITGVLGGDRLASAVSGAPSLNTAATASSNVGDYAIVAGSGTLASDLNYGFQFTNGTLHIDPAPLTVTADDKTREYGLASPTLTASFSGLRNGDTASVISGLTLSTPATIGSNVGAYAIASAGGTAANYAITTRNNGTLSVTPAPLTLTADDKTREYGLANPTLTASFSGLRNGDTASVVSGFSLSTPATVGSNVGTYAITIAGGTAANYAITIRNNGTLAVGPAILSAGLTGTVTKVFDGTDSAALASGNYTLAGVLLGDNVALNNPANGQYADSNVGSNKSVGVSGLALSGTGASNYRLAATNVSAPIGVISAAADPTFDNSVLIDFIVRPLNTPLVSATAGIPAPVVGTHDATDATSATSEVGEDADLANTVADKLGKSLSGAPGSVQLSSTVLIEGLLRQFQPAPGGLTPHGVPPFGQIYSSWGNEAFWQ